MHRQLATSFTIKIDSADSWPSWSARCTGSILCGSFAFRVLRADAKNRWKDRVDIWRGVPAFLTPRGIAVDLDGIVICNCPPRDHVDKGFFNVRIIENGKIAWVDREVVDYFVINGEESVIYEIYLTIGAKGRGLGTYLMELSGRWK